MDKEQAKQILGLTNDNFSKEEVAKACKNLSIKWHPDKYDQNPATHPAKSKKEAEEMSKKINSAKDALLAILEAKKLEKCHVCGGYIFTVDEWNEYYDTGRISKGPREGMKPDVCHCIRCGRKKEPGTIFTPGTKGYKEHLYCSECLKQLDNNPNCQKCGKICRPFPRDAGNGKSVCSKECQKKEDNSGLGWNNNGGTEDWQKYNQELENNPILRKYQEHYQKFWGGIENYKKVASNLVKEIEEKSSQLGEIKKASATDNLQQLQQIKAFNNQEINKREVIIKLMEQVFQKAENGPSHNNNNPPPQNFDPKIDTTQITNSETIEKAQKYAKEQINKWFQESGVKPSDLNSNLWNNAESWEKHLLTINNKEEIVKFAERMKQAIKNKSNTKFQTNNKKPDSNNNFPVPILIFLFAFVFLVVVFLIVWKRKKKQKTRQENVK